MVKKTLLWGFLLWLFGYMLGFMFFAVVPPALLGWVIMPFGLAATVWVLYKKFPVLATKDALITGVVWAMIAIVGDYLLLVQVLHPADGYYKLDVYLYYATTLVLPLIISRLRTRR